MSEEAIVHKVMMRLEVNESAEEVRRAMEDWLTGMVDRTQEFTRTKAAIESFGFVEVKTMRTKKAKKGPAEPHPCLCGCGEIVVTGNKFRPGHDSRHHAAIAAGFKTWAEKEAAEAEEKAAKATVKAEAKAAREKVKAEKAEARMRAKEAKILAEAEKAEARKAKAEAEAKKLEELKAKAAKPAEEIEKTVSEDLKNGRKEAIREAAKKHKKGR